MSKKQDVTNHACPNCGYCPHCGRGPWWGVHPPYYPAYPFMPIEPTWISPTWTTSGNVGNTTNVQIPTNTI